MPRRFQTREYRDAEDCPRRDYKAHGGNRMMPQEVREAVERIVAIGKEAIVKKERGKWVVLEQGKRLVFKEP